MIKRLTTYFILIINLFIFSACPGVGENFGTDEDGIQFNDSDFDGDGSYDLDTSDPTNIPIGIGKGEEYRDMDPLRIPVDAYVCITPDGSKLVLIYNPETDTISIYGETKMFPELAYGMTIIVKNMETGEVAYVNVNEDGSFDAVEFDNVEPEYSQTPFLVSLYNPEDDVLIKPLMIAQSVVSKKLNIYSLNIKTKKMTLAHQKDSSLAQFVYPAVIYKYNITEFEFKTTPDDVEIWQCEEVDDEIEMEKNEGQTDYYRDDEEIDPQDLIDKNYGDHEKQGVVNLEDGSIDTEEESSVDMEEDDPSYENDEDSSFEENPSTDNPITKKPRIINPSW